MEEKSLKLKKDFSTGKIDVYILKCRTFVLFHASFKTNAFWKFYSVHIVAGLKF